LRLNNLKRIQRVAALRLCYKGAATSMRYRLVRPLRGSGSAIPQFVERIPVELPAAASAFLPCFKL
jgi:hypothetical protein